jgi:hypothetical protein
MRKSPAYQELTFPEFSGALSLRPSDSKAVDAGRLLQPSRHGPDDLIGSELFELGVV